MIKVTNRRAHRHNDCPTDEFVDPHLTPFSSRTQPAPFAAQTNRRKQWSGTYPRAIRLPSRRDPDARAFPVNAPVTSCRVLRIFPNGKRVRVGRPAIGQVSRPLNDHVTPRKPEILSD